MTKSLTNALTRRAFLRTAAATPALLPVVRAAAADDETLFRMVRREFPFDEDRVPMNAANLCPSPRSVGDRVSELTRDIDHDCSFQNRGKFADLRETAREQVAAQLGVSGDELALVRNTSEANNIVNAGIPLGEGDEVLLWDQNHPTNNVAWDVRAARYGFSVRRVSVPKAPASEEDLAAPFIEAFGANTKVVAITHVSNVSGIRMPSRLIADAAHERGIHVHVDGAQSFGGLSVDVPAIGADTFRAVRTSGSAARRSAECSRCARRSFRVCGRRSSPRAGAAMRTPIPPAPGSSSPWGSATTPVSRPWAPRRNSTARSARTGWRNA